MTGRISSMAAYAAGPSSCRRRPCGNANCQRPPACHGGVNEKVCSLSVRIGFMYGALASDVADARAGSGARRAVRLISAVAYCQLFKSYISVWHIRWRCHLVLLATPWNLSSLLADRPLWPIACRSNRVLRNFYNIDTIRRSVCIHGLNEPGELSQRWWQHHKHCHSYYYYYYY